MLELNQTPSLTRRTVIAGIALSSAMGLKAQSTRTLSFAHGTAEDNPRHIAAMRFAELVSKGTSGRITIAVTPNSKLADDTAAIEAMQAGTIDMSANSQGPYPSSYLSSPAWVCLIFSILHSKFGEYCVDQSAMNLNAMQMQKV